MDYRTIKFFYFLYIWNKVFIIKDQLKFCQTFLLNCASFLFLPSGFSKLRIQSVQNLTDEFG